MVGWVVEWRAGRTEIESGSRNIYREMVLVVACPFGARRNNTGNEARYLVW